MTKTTMKNTRWALMEQRLTFLEEKMKTCLDGLKVDIEDIKKNDIAHLHEAIKGMESAFTSRQDKCEAKLDGMQAIIYKAMGAAAAIITVVNIVLKVWK